MTAAGPDGLVRLSPGDPEQVDAIARLHAEVLPRSAPARLGHRFMTDFYFRRLPEEGLLTADLYRHEGRYVAFCTYTRTPDSFMGEALKRHFLSLCWLGLRIVLEDPRRLLALVDLVRKSGGLSAPEGLRVGYWLTFGVQEPFRRIRVGESGIRISKALVDSMLAFFRAEGFDRLDGAVERENKSAILFYHSCGFRVEDPGRGGDLEIHLDLARG